MLSSLIHPVSFMIVMYISAIIVLAEYGKVLRKDPEYLNFLKRWNQDYSPFMSTEFFPNFNPTKYPAESIPHMSNK